MVPTFLSGDLADRPAERLDDVDGRAARVDERDAVDARHVHALAEAAGVAEQAALVRRKVAEAKQQPVAVSARHRARDVVAP